MLDRLNVNVIYVILFRFYLFILFQIYTLARETVVLLLEGNPDIGTLLDWVVDRCYTGAPQVADGCFLALATIFSARYAQIKSINKYFIQKYLLGVVEEKYDVHRADKSYEIHTSRQNYRYKPQIE